MAYLEEMMFFKSIIKNQFFLLIFITILGFFLMFVIYQTTSNDIREEMITQANIIANSIDLEKLKVLTGTETDLILEEYIYLQNYFSEVIYLNPKYQFLTIISRNEKNDFIFFNFVGFNEVNERITVSPGTPYLTDNPQILDIFNLQRAKVFGPNVDEYGKFLTALVPIIDKENGQMLAFFTMDYDYGNYSKTIFDKLLYPIIMLIMMYIISLIGLSLISSRKKVAEHTQRILKQREAISKFTTNYEYDSIDFLKTLDNLCQMVGDTLNIDRVSVWTMKPDSMSMVCESMYSLQSQTISRGQEIFYERFPKIYSMYHTESMISVPDIKKSDYFNDFYEQYMKVGDGFKSVIYSIIKQEGNIIGVLSLATHTHYRNWDSDEKAYVDTITALMGQTFNRDKREKAEQELIDTNLRFINTLENIEDGYIYIDQNHICKFINYQAYAILNLKIEMLVNKVIWTVLNEELAKPLKLIVENAMIENQPLVKTEHFPDMNKWIEIKVYPSNKDTSIFMVDVTKIKQAEQTFIDNHRLSVIGEMAYSFAHDFNNFLQVILSNIQILENKLTSEKFIKNYVDTIYRTTNDAAVRVQLLQRFAGSRNKKSEYELINLNKITKEAILQASSIWKTEAETNGLNIDINEYYDDLPNIYGNDGELRTAIYNMIKNSVEAMNRDGLIKFETRRDEQGVFLQISDTGCGIKEDKFSKIFEPFYSTKSLDIGKGLGLSFVYNVITEHKGSIKVLSSSPEKGTVFEIFLPLYDLGESEIATQNKTIIKEKPVIMWVDDDPLIRETAGEMMNIIGYDVDMVEGGEEALELFKTKKYDILLSDVGMPRMNGWQLVDKVNELYRSPDSQSEKNENLKITLITGWGDQITEAQKKQYNIDFVLSKPVKLQQLKKLIEDLLSIDNG